MPLHIKILLLQFVVFPPFTSQYLRSQFKKIRDDKCGLMNSIWYYANFVTSTQSHTFTMIITVTDTAKDDKYELHLSRRETLLLAQDFIAFLRGFLCLCRTWIFYLHRDFLRKRLIKISLNVFTFVKKML